MATPEATRQPRARIGRIAVPVDFSPTSSIAFDHALKLAVQTPTELEVIHVQRRPGPLDWERRMRLESRLEAWGIAGAPDSTPSGFRLKTTLLQHRNPSQALTEHLLRHPADMLVLGSHGRRGIERLLARPVAMPVAASANTTTLFFPTGARGFVRPNDGSLSLTRVIVPVDHTPPAEPALEALETILQAFRVPFVSCTAIHVGSPEKAPRIPCEPYPWTCLTLYRRGDTVFEILRAAAETSADLLVMSTAGKKTLGEALRGSTAERVIRDAPCPVLAVPAAFPPAETSGQGESE